MLLLNFYSFIQLFSFKNTYLKFKSRRLFINFVNIWMVLSLIRMDGKEYLNIDLKNLSLIKTKSRIRGVRHCKRIVNNDELRLTDRIICVYKRCQAPLTNCKSLSRLIVLFNFLHEKSTCLVGRCL